MSNDQDQNPRPKLRLIQGGLSSSPSRPSNPSSFDFEEDPSVITDTFAELLARLADPLAATEEPFYPLASLAKYKEMSKNSMNDEPTSGSSESSQEDQSEIKLGPNSVVYREEEARRRAALHHAAMGLDLVAQLERVRAEDLANGAPTAEERRERRARRRASAQAAAASAEEPFSPTLKEEPSALPQRKPNLRLIQGEKES